MNSNSRKAKKKWYANGRWAFVLALIGILMLAFVILTQGNRAAWIMWIALPLLMVSLGYLFLVNAVKAVWGGDDHEQERKS